MTTLPKERVNHDHEECCDHIVSPVYSDCCICVCVEGDVLESQLICRKCEPENHDGVLALTWEWPPR